MVTNVIQKLAASVAESMGSGFTSDALGHLREGKVYKYGPGEVASEIGPDDRRGNYLYMRLSDGNTVRLEAKDRGGCKICSYKITASLLLVLQSDCIDPESMASAAVDALVSASPKISAARINIREYMAPAAALPEAVAAARCHLAAVAFDFSGIVDFSKCLNIELC